MKTSDYQEGGIARWILGVSFAAGFITISLSPASALAQATQAPPSVLALKTQASPFAWSATENPLVPVLATDGQYHLEYQLLFVNAKTFAATLTSGEVLNAETEMPTGNNTTLSGDGADVSFMWRLFANTPSFLAESYVDKIGKGQAGLMYFWLSYPSLDAVPSGLKHRFSSTATPVEGRTVNYTAEDDGTPISSNGPLVISPPLSGSGWFDANGAGPTVFAHRYGVAPTNGALRPQEVFAIDWIKLDAQGRAYVGDLTKVENYFGYGQPIISATDGVVVVTVDGRPNQIPPAQPTIEDLEETPGNRVIVATQNGQSVEYVEYCHLIPGSVAVKVGQTVHVGQRLGLLGNSGNSTAPHLHFQVSDAPSVIDSNSLPFVIDRMFYQSHVVGTPIPTLDAMLTEGFIPPFDTTGRGWRKLQMPLEFDVIDFPQQTQR